MYKTFEDFIIHTSDFEKIHEKKNDENNFLNLVSLNFLTLQLATFVFKIGYMFRSLF